MVGIDLGYKWCSVSVMKKGIPETVYSRHYDSSWRREYGSVPFFNALQRDIEDSSGIKFEEAYVTLPFTVSYPERIRILDNAKKAGIVLIYRGSPTVMMALYVSWKKNLDSYYLFCLADENEYEVSVHEIGDGIVETHAVIGGYEDPGGRGLNRLYRDAANESLNGFVGCIYDLPESGEYIIENCYEDRKEYLCHRSVISKGCALEAAKYAGDKIVEDILLLSAVPYSLGFRMADGTVCTLVSRNTTVPTWHSIQYYIGNKTPEDLYLLSSVDDEHWEEIGLLRIPTNEKCDSYRRILLRVGIDPFLNISLDVQDEQKRTICKTDNVARNLLELRSGYRTAVNQCMLYEYLGEISYLKDKLHPVLDDLKKVLEVKESRHQKYAEGIEMIYERLKDTL